MNAKFLRNMVYAASVCALSGNAVAVTYTFTVVADTLGSLDDLPDGSASINNSGTIAYQGESPANQFNIYTSVSGTPLIADKVFDSEPVINDAGTVVVSMQDGATAGVYNGTTSSFIIDSSGSSFTDFADVAINGGGTIAFVGDTSINTFSPLTLIDDASGANDTFIIADVNDSGTAMYVADLDAGDQAVYTSASGTAIFSAPTIPSAAISNSGTVVYTDRTTAVYTDATVLEATGGTFSQFEGVAINSSDTVAILGAAGGAFAIYTDDGTTLEKVIDSNDSMPDGDLIVGMSMGSHAINDSGQIVFWVTAFDIGTFSQYEAIVLATPDIPFLLGDINVDGVVDTADNLLLSRFVLGLATPTATEITAGDMDLDTQLTTADMLLHIKAVLGI